MKTRVKRLTCTYASLKPMEIQAILALTILFELLTVAPRLILKIRSREVQKRIGMPRIHHGYIGMVFLLASYVFVDHATALWIIGWALVISDLIHHYTILPLLSVTEIDIHQKHYGLSTTALTRKVLILGVGSLVAVVLTFTSTSIWIAVAAMFLIAISENLKELMPRCGCPREIAMHF